VWTYFLLTTGQLKKKLKFIALLNVATQLCGYEIIFGLLVPNAVLNECLFIHVMAPPVSNSHEKVLSPSLTINLGLI